MLDNLDGVKVTCGEVFSHAVIDLIRPAGSEEIQLICCDGASKEQIGLQVEHDGTIYRRPNIHLSVLTAVRFPAGLKEYATPSALFESIAAIVRQFASLPTDLAYVVAVFAFSTWLLEAFQVAPVLCVTSSSPFQVDSLFRVLNCICRHPLRAAELARNLPLEVGITLLLTNSGASARQRALWRAAGYDGVFASEGKGRLGNLRCAKAVFCSDPTEDWVESMLLSLPPGLNVPVVTPAQQAEIAAELQAQMQLWRVRQLLQPRPGGGPRPPKWATGSLSRGLLACVPEDPTVKKIIEQLLETQQEDANLRTSRDPLSAIICGLWGPVHGSRSITPAELTKDVNAWLQSKGEFFEYTPREIGWKLRSLRLYTSRGRNSKNLRFTTAVRSRVHQLARKFSFFGTILDPKDGCAECKRSQIAQS